VITAVVAHFDPQFKRVLWYLIGSTKGGANRARILELINSHPANPNQISSELKLDYKTTIHHLSVLTENGLVVVQNEQSYGASINGKELQFIHGDTG
jgi:predicted transcriptional regulator